MDELKHFMTLAKLQVPTQRNLMKKPKKDAGEEESVRELVYGSVEVTKVELKPTSCGRERFGKGTKDWPKFPMETEPVKRFYT